MNHSPLPSGPSAPGRALVVALVAALVVALPAAPGGPVLVAYAQEAPVTEDPTTDTTSPVDAAPLTPERRQALEDELDEATAEELRLGSELAAATAERDRLAALLADVERRSAEAVAAHRSAEEALGRATAELGAARARLRSTERALAEALGDLRDQAVESFIVGGNDDELTVLARADDLREAGAAATYRDVVLERQDLLVERVERLKVRRERRADAAADAADAAAGAVEAAADLSGVVDAERSELKVLEAANAAAVATHAELLAEVQQRKATYQEELGELVELSDSIAAALAQRQVDQVADPALAGTFVVPVPSARMSSGFGFRVHPVFGIRRLHAGMDLAAPTGTPVVAAGAGTVVTSGNLGGYGNTVVIDHGNGLSTLYAHMSVLHLEVGDTVAAGQLVGAVGTTGTSTGPHLHFEVRRFGIPVDPVAYL